MSLFTKLAASAVISALLLIGGIWTGEKLNTVTVTSSPSFGAFTPVGAQQTTLSGSGVIATATTIPVTSFKTPDGRALTMSMFGQIGYAVLDPNSPTQIEDITFSGITQNANGTASLTGVSRGMDFVSPYLASTTLAKAHAGGAYLILSNTAGFYGQQFLFANNVSTSSATLIFGSTTQPMYDGNPAVWSSPLSLVDKAYVDSGVLNGAATSTFANQGLVWLATLPQVAAGTASSTTGSPLVIPTKNATSTPYSGTPAGYIPATASGGKISQLFLDIFTTANIWTAQNTFSGLFATNASSTNATTTVISATIASTTNLVASTKVTFPSNCTNCTITAVTSTTTTFAAPTTAAIVSGTVFCVSPKLVAGGGVSGIPTSQGGTSGSWTLLEASYPSSASAWTATVECHIDNTAGCSSGTITVYALCVNP